MTSNEVNDLYNYGYKIIQNKDYFKFSLDSILLADFVKLDYCDKRIMDLCTGNAPIPIILSSKNIEITAVELQKEIYDMAFKSIEINNINNVNLMNENVKSLKNYFPGNNFDVITCNPPYFKYDENSIVNTNIVKTIARHEKELTLEEMVEMSKYLLRDKGKLDIVFRNDRLIELFDCLHKYSFGIKRMQFVFENVNSNSSMVLIEAKKNCKDNVEVLKPLITNNYRGDKE